MTVGHAVKRFVQNPKVIKVLTVVVVEIVNMAGRVLMKRGR
jgi:hypothetical protein